MDSAESTAIVSTSWIKIVKMGQDIRTSRFEEQDFLEFEERLLEETRLLEQWFSEGRFAEDSPVGGFEAEAWLIHADCSPAPENESFLARLRNPDVVPELAKFNVEINTPPLVLQGSALTFMETNLRRNWNHCNEIARDMDLELLATGILPTLNDRHLTLDNMSSQERFRALNEQVLHLRQEQPITLDIEQVDHLFAVHRDVMLEAAATSFQIHLQVRASSAPRFYNASVLASAPLVAVAANSPYLFGASLWDETRIPLFEQAVSVAPRRSQQAKRVTLGAAYVRESLVECFRENLGTYAVLLPTLMDERTENFAHLRLHNGTIWRWNRPLLGFDAFGAPHFRIEHRVVPAGPSLVDMIANAALYFGFVHALAEDDVPPELRISFSDAKNNFYAAARWGLEAELVWLDHKRVAVRSLLTDVVLPLARSGLVKLGLDIDDVSRFLGIIEGRLRTGQTGTVWQRAFIRRFGMNRKALTSAYREHQNRGKPVHEWDQY